MSLNSANPSISSRFWKSQNLAEKFFGQTFFAYFEVCGDFQKDATESSNLK